LLDFAKSAARVSGPACGGWRERLRVVRYVLRKKLQGDEAPKFSVFSRIDYTHTSAAQLLDDAVARDGFHWRESYVSKTDKSTKAMGLAGLKSIIVARSL